MRVILLATFTVLVALSFPLQAATAPVAPAPVEADCSPAGPEALPKLAADLEGLLQDLYARYAHLPGFVDVHYVAAEGGRFVALFHATVPADFAVVPSDVVVTATVLPELHEPVATTDASAGPDQIGVDDVLCTGIRPGSRLTVGNTICSLAFIYTDGSRVYATTAGHCINTGQTASVSGIGVIGTAVYSTGAGGFGNDFALIEINPSRHAQVDPAMCDFGGPTFTQTSSPLGLPVQHSGHGGGLVNAPARPKVGVGGSWGARTFAWVGQGIPGDSGSGVETSLGGMMGIVTQLGVGVIGTNFGHRPGPYLQDAGYGHLTLMTAPLNTL